MAEAHDTSLTSVYVHGTKQQRGSLTWVIENSSAPHGAVYIFDDTFAASTGQREYCTIGHVRGNGRAYFV